MALSPPTAPTAPDLNSPSTYNARVLAGFTYCFTTLPDWIAGLDASDWFSVQSSATDTTAGTIALQGNDADFADMTAETIGLTNVDGTTNFLTLTGARNVGDSEIGILFKDRDAGAGASNAGRINTERQSTANSFDMVFSTTLGGTMSEAMRIDGSANVSIGGVTPAAKLHVEQSDTGTIGYFNGANASFSGNQLTLDMDRTANAISKFIACYSGGTADLEFKVAGDGNVTADGTVAGGGADRAECIERHPDWFAEVGGQDMRGVTVVLDGGFIRPAEPGEEPVGVISDTYDSLGNAAPLKWADKYLKDNLGSYLWEDYEVVEWVETVTETTTETEQATEEITRARDVIEVENGTAIKRTITETVQVPVFDEFPMQDEAGNDLGTHRAPRMIEVERVTEKEVAHSYAADAVPEGVTVPEDATRTTQRRKVLNPDFDPAAEYTPRLDRPEWDAVGVLGICRVLKGQPVGSRWIKMRDVSGEVEEWLVR